MTVRRATETDAEAVARVHVLTWQAAYRDVFPPERLDALDPRHRAPGWRERLAAGALVLVDEQRTGFASAGPSRDEEGAGELYAIYVLPERWGGGLARRLLAAAEEELRAAGFERATLWVLAENPRARGFYEACGWRADGTSRRVTHLGVEVEELRYRKPLS